MQKLIHNIKGNLPILVNAVGFQLGWSIAVWAGDWPAILYTFCFLVIHFKFFSLQQEWIVVATIVLVGIAIDSILAKLSILQFEQSGVIIPVWLICIWVLYATTLAHTLAWLKTQILLAAVLGAVFGPLAYYAGMAIIGKNIGLPLMQGLLLFSTIWAMLLPASIWWANCLVRNATSEQID